MQLKANPGIRQAVSALTATLLGAAPSAASESNRVESSLLIYAEKDRVIAAEGIVNATRSLGENSRLSLHLTFDGLTGASPNGALPSRRVQTFTRPSGGGVYIVPPGQTPLDNTFSDQRYAFDVAVTRPAGRVSMVTLGLSASNERDYMSFGAMGGVTRDFNQRNTTLSLSGTYSHDLVRPMGGAPEALAPMAPPRPGGESEGEEGEDDEGAGPGEQKNVGDIVLGVTQVLGRQTLMRLSYSFNYTSGYLTDPYKLLSVVSGPASPGPGETESYRYEGRPSSRSRHALYAGLRRWIGGTVVDLSYRYFTDDWGIRSHTAELFYRWSWGNGKSLEPHVRWYRQTDADFHRDFLVAGDPLPAFASADYRLAAFDARTLGLQYSMPVRTTLRISVGAEYYMQRSGRSPPDRFGAMLQQDPFPKLDAVMVRTGLAADF